MDLYRRVQIVHRAQGTCPPNRPLPDKQHRRKNGEGTKRRYFSFQTENVVREEARLSFLPPQLACPPPFGGAPSVRPHSDKELNTSHTRRLFLAIIVASLVAKQTVAQTTYSRAEERMAQYVNNGLAYALKYDSLQRIPPVLDSCRRFLQHFPNSFVKPNVFSYMLEMSSLITTDKETLYPLIDSVLYYDKLPGTAMRIGELLIEREIDPSRGARIIEETLPHLDFDYHRYKSHLLLSEVALSHGDFLTAESHLKSALEIDSVRLDAWFAYLGFYQLREDEAGASRVSGEISRIENKRRHRYFEYVEHNSYVGKSIADLTSTGLNGDTVRFAQFANRVLVIQFFNFWCSAPGKEFPTIRKLMKEFPQPKFVFLNFDETPEELKMRYFTRPSSSFLKDQTVIFPDSSIADFFGGSGVMGEILLVDRHGRIRFSFPGMAEGYEAAIRTKLRMLLEEP